MRRFLILMISVLLCLPAVAMEPAPKTRSSSSVKKERQDANRKIKQTKQRLAENQKKVSQKLNELMEVQSQMEGAQRKITDLERKITALDRNIALLTDSINILNQNIDVLRQSSAKSLRDARQRNQTMSAWSMILSATSFNQAMRRAGYLQELEKSRIKSTKRLNANLADLEAKKARLQTLKGQQATSKQNLSDHQQSLAQQQGQVQGLVDELKKQGTTLERELADRKSRLDQLNAELERAIVEEERKAREEEERRLEAERKRQEAERIRLEAERKAEEERLLALEKERQAQEKANEAPSEKPTPEPKPQPAAEPKPKKQEPVLTQPAKTTPVKQASTFVKSKGRLLFPVSGKYTIIGQFGRSQYGDLSKVEIENPGIDILTAPGSSARAVYPGTVSSIFNMNGYHHIVMVRHGEYITIYANIDKLDVRKGDNVNAGQQLGEIYTDKSDNRTILHFEVRKEKEKLNPMDWLQP